MHPYLTLSASLLGGEAIFVVGVDSRRHRHGKRLADGHFGHFYRIPGPLRPSAARLRTRHDRGSNGIRYYVSATLY